MSVSLTGAASRSVARFDLASPEIACVMLTSYADDEALFAAIMAGAAGYVLKQVESTDLVDAVRRVAAGQSLLDPVLTERVLARLREGPKEDSRLASLTPQERRILDLIADGQTNRQIADIDVPRREDRQELRLQRVGEARNGATHPGCDLRRPSRRTIAAIVAS